MAVSVLEDLIGEQRIVQGANGIEAASRGFIVSGLADITNAHSRTLAALARLPKRYEPHPRYSWLLRGNIDLEHIDSGTVRAVAEYALPAAIEATDGEDGQPQPDRPSPATLSISTSVIELDTYRDADGEIIVLPYRPLRGPGREIADQEIQTRVQIPTVTLSYTRREIGTPLAKSLEYVGKVNKEPLGVAQDRQGNVTFQLNPRTVLCSSITGTTEGRGDTRDNLVFQVNYEFRLAPAGSTWDTTTPYFIRENGVIPRDVQVLPTITDANAPTERTTADPVNTAAGMMYGVRLYKEADFNDLELEV